MANSRTVGDFTKMFRDFEELADFIMMPNEEQDAILASLAEEGKAEGMEMSCDLAKKAALAKEKADGLAR